MVGCENETIYHLVSHEQALVQRLCESLPLYKPDDLESFVEASAAIVPLLPGGVHGWALRSKANGFGLLRGLPLGQVLPPTPLRKFEADGKAMPADAVIGLITAMFGNIVTFEGKHSQRQIHNVYCALDETFSQLGGSAAFLDWHVEDGFHPSRADWLAILCLRSDPAVITWLARARDLDLTSSDRSWLCAQPVRMRVDESFSPPHRGQVFEVVTLSGTAADPEIAFDPEYTDTGTEHDRLVLNRLSEAANRVKLSFRLDAGDLLVINNRKTIHARSALVPRFDGTDRWIKRALIVDQQIVRKGKARYLVAFPGL